MLGFYDRRTPMSNYNHKHVHDPVHGTIGLSTLEVEVISSRVFQRLHHIKQLDWLSLSIQLLTIPAFPIRLEPAISLVGCCAQ